jgi:hypothetical protein
LFSAISHNETHCWFYSRISKEEKSVLKILRIWPSFAGVPEIEFSPGPISYPTQSAFLAGAIFLDRQKEKQGAFVFQGAKRLVRHFLSAKRRGRPFRDAAEIG